MNTYLVYYSYKDDKLNVPYKRTLRAESLEDAIKEINKDTRFPFNHKIHSCVLINDDWDLVSDVAFEVHKYIRDNED